MVTSPNEWKILEWVEKPQTNKQTNKQTTRRECWEPILTQILTGPTRWQSSVCHSSKYSLREIHFYSNSDSLILSGKQYFVNWI